MRLIQGLMAVFTMGIAGHVTADVIKACARETSGRIRIVGDLGMCTDREAALSWSTNLAPPRFQLVGFTATVVGEEPVVLDLDQPMEFADNFVIPLSAMNAACQLDFSEQAHVCTREELQTTGSYPDIPTSRPWAWFAGSDSINDNRCVRKHGSGNEAGDMVSRRGTLSVGKCIFPRPVACCAPAP